MYNASNTKIDGQEIDGQEQGILGGQGRRPEAWIPTVRKRGASEFSRPPQSTLEPEQVSEGVARFSRRAFLGNRSLRCCRFARSRRLRCRGCLGLCWRFDMSFRLQFLLELSLGSRPFHRIAGTAQELKIGRLVAPSLREWLDMIHGHISGREFDTTPIALPILKGIQMRLIFVIEGRSRPLLRCERVEKHHVKNLRAGYRNGGAIANV